MAHMVGNRQAMSIYIDPEKKQQLDLLSETSGQPVSVHLREAVDDLLKKYSKELRRAKR